LRDRVRLPISDDRAFKLVRKPPIERTSMPVRLDQSGDLCLLRLEGEISVGVATELKDVLLRALASRTEVRLDLEHATEFDVTALQLLWAAEREAHRSGKAFTLVTPVPRNVLLATREAGLKAFPFALDAQPAP
jgi:anti-anti-sigma factor